MGNNDSTTGAMTTITYEHHEIHSGSGFMFTRDVVVPAANDDELLLVTPDSTKWAHFIFTVTCDAAYDFDMYEGTGLTTPTDLSTSILNMNRNSTKTSGLTIGHTPAGGAGDGTIIWAFSGGANKSVTSATNRQEIVLKQNESYLFRLSASQNDVGHWMFTWYEHTNKRPGKF